MAELAQDLVWHHGVKPKDAIHVGTPLVASAQFFDTFDGGLASVSGKVGGSPALRNGPPTLSAQQEIHFSSAARVLPPAQE